MHAGAAGAGREQVRPEVLHRLLHPCLQLRVNVLQRTIIHRRCHGISVLPILNSEARRKPAPSTSLFYRGPGRLTVARDSFPPPGRPARTSVRTTPARHLSCILGGPARRVPLTLWISN